MKDYFFTTDEETTARISGQRDNIYDYVIDRFKDLLSNNDIDSALCLADEFFECCLLYTSPSPRDATLSRMPSSA